MKRRDFIKSTLIVPVAVLAPSLVLAKSEYVPKTAQELHEAINTLGKPKASISKKSWEEAIEGRYIHESYSLGHQNPENDTEEVLVKRVWENMLEVFSEHPNNSPVIYWRRIPEYKIEAVDVNFDSADQPHFEKYERRAYLRMRLSIGTTQEKSNFKSFLVKEEGNRSVYIGRKWE